MVGMLALGAGERERIGTWTEMEAFHPISEVDARDGGLLLSCATQKREDQSIKF